MQQTIRVCLASLGLLALLGCAAAPSKPDPRDPWERMNRSVYKFNDAFDRALAKPVARTYRKATPQVVQTGVTNFFDNLEYPITIVNDLLQGQFKGFALDTTRLLMNTTLGLGGLFDPASKAGLEKNQRDFGQTLGVWGVKPGPYLMLPILGPSNVRDSVGLVADQYANPRTYIDNDWVKYGFVLVRAVDVRTRLLSTDALLESAYDPYAFLRNAYLQRREFLITGGKPSESEEERQRKLFEEAEEEDSGAAPQSPPPPQDQQPK